MSETTGRQFIQGHRYRWLFSVAHDEQACQLASKYNLCVPLVQTLINRGFDCVEKIEPFLFTAYEQEIGNPRDLKDAQKTVERIKRALDAKEKILIVGDYDVDGVTSTALMMICLLRQHANVNFFLPHRARDGYGISASMVRKAAANGYTLIITVDNGITAFEAAQAARECKIDLIITDHHLPHERVPDAYAIVDPLQIDCAYPFKYLAGVGVAFKIMMFLYELLGQQLPQKVFELLMLGTVADMVPLISENRYWVRKGLISVNDNPSYALTCLAQQSKLDSKISALDVAFFLAPQLNALGRLEDPRQGVIFLMSENNAEIVRIGDVLFSLNQARKDIERSITAEICASITRGEIDLTHDHIIVAASKSWPMGVIGLVASRLVNEYARPVILFHIGEDGIARGSARSIPAFNIFDALAQNAMLLEHFGGHAMAAGLRMHVSHISELKDSLENRMSELVTEEDLISKITIDASINLSDATGKFVDDLGYFEPFGSMNTSPMFHIAGVTLIERPQLLKNAHVKCRVFSQGIIKPVIFFNSPQLYPILCEMGDKQFDLAGEVVENYWRGARSIEFKGVDIAII